MATDDTSHVPASRTEQPRWRVWAIRIWYGLLSLQVVSATPAIVGLALDSAESGNVFSAGAVLAFKLLWVGPVIGIALTGGRSVVAFQALVVGMAAGWSSELLWAVQPEDSVPLARVIAGVMIYILPLVLLRSHRAELLVMRQQPSVYLLSLAIILAVPAVAYSVHQGRLAVDLDGGIHHYDMCSLGIVLAVQAIWAALRPHATHWLPRYVAGCAAMLGLFAITWSADVASFGAAWGTALVIWAALFLVSNEVEVWRSLRQRSIPAAH